MSKIFSKDKDWVVLIGYVALIYSTLQFMPRVSSFFSSLLGRYFGVASNSMLVIVILAIFILVFKRKPTIKNLILFYAAMTLIFVSYLALLLFALPIVAEKMHLLEYGFLSYLALRAVKGSQGKIGTVPEACCRVCPQRVVYPLKGTDPNVEWLSLKDLSVKMSHFSSKQSLYVVLIIIIVGSLDEFIQGFTPGRYCELRDVILNIVSGTLGLFVLKLLKPERYQ